MVVRRCRLGTYSWPARPPTKDTDTVDRLAPTTTTTSLPPDCHPRPSSLPPSLPPVVTSTTPLVCRARVREERESESSPSCPLDCPVPAQCTRAYIACLAALQHRQQEPPATRAAAASTSLPSPCQPRLSHVHTLPAPGPEIADRELVTALARCPQGLQRKQLASPAFSLATIRSLRRRRASSSALPFYLDLRLRSSTLCIACCWPYRACILQYLLAHNVVQEQLPLRAGLAELTITRARKWRLRNSPPYTPRTTCLPLQCSKAGLPSSTSNNDTPLSRPPTSQRVHPSLGGTGEAAQMLPTPHQDPRRPLHLRGHTTK